MFTNASIFIRYDTRETGLISESLVQSVLNFSFRIHNCRICALVQHRYLRIDFYAAKTSLNVIFTKKNLAGLTQMCNIISVH